MISSPVVSLSIGVIGNMDLSPSETERVKEFLRILFRILRSKPDGNDRDELLRKLHELTLCKAICDASSNFANSVVEEIRHWPDLQDLPITVFSNMAPGADTLAVEVAMEDLFAKNNFSIRAVLPYPSDLYCDLASTFNAKNREGTADPTNAANRNHFKELINSIGETNCYVVRKWNETRIDDISFYNQCKNELEENDVSARHARYFAAGEYLAQNCQLLIAFWDSDFDSDTENGTGAIVFSRRFGPRAKVLPTTSHLGIPHGGPLIHIPVRRNKSVEKQGIPVESPLIRFLHPFAYTDEIEKGAVAGPSDIAKIAKSEYQSSGLRVLGSVLDNLVWFHSRKNPDDPELRTELADRLTPKIIESLRSEEPSSFVSLSRLLETRKKATLLQRQLEPANRRALRRMFWSVGIAAILFHLFAEWHPQLHDVRKTDHNNESSIETTEGRSKPEGSHASNDVGIRPYLGLASALAVAFGICTYLRAKSSRSREHSDDLRALAEGLRVQFYWNITGVGRSVPANYSLRQRSELDWIRNVIRSTSAPYDRWSRWFSRLSNAMQFQMLEVCLQGWVMDQEDYFRKASAKKQNELHFWHRLGVLFAWAGVVIALVLVVLNSVGFRLMLLQNNVAIASIAIIPLATLAFCLASVISESKANRQSHHPASPFKGKMSNALFSIVHAILPYDDEHDSTDSVRRSIKNFFIGLPSILLLFYSGLVAAAIFANIPYPVPDTFTLSSVLAGAFLLIGGLMIAWGEKMQLSETGYQYNTMASLYRVARIQFEKHLSDMRAFSSDAGKADAYQEVLVQLQEFIYELGRESLDENAEWLILHRARPLEPVMAG